MKQDNARGQRLPSQAIAAGMRWASTISGIAAEMAVPPLVGYWLDEQFGTSPLWMLILALAGFATAMTHLWQLAKRLGARDSRSAGPSRGPGSGVDRRDHNGSNRE